MKAIVIVILGYFIGTYSAEYVLKRKINNIAKHFIGLCFPILLSLLISLFLSIISSMSYTLGYGYITGKYFSLSLPGILMYIIRFYMILYKNKHKS